MRRRHLLVLTGGALSASLSGCLSDDVDGTDDDEADGNGTDSGTGDTDEADSDTDTEVEALLAGGFNAVSQGGFISLNEGDGPDHAREEGVILPAEENGEDPFRIEGESGDDGTWESTAIELPELGVEDFTVEIDFPDGIHGEMRESDGVMTLRGEANVLIADGEFSFDFEATTGDSGVMSGELALDSEPMRIVAVDNEFTVDEETDTLVDSVIGLPSGESGRNWLQVVLEIQEF